MSHDFLPTSSLGPLLLAIDCALTAEAKEAGCPFCRGPLHRADYARKPRGLRNQAPEFSIRHSLCCGHCRRRTTPASARFLDRRVWLGVVVVLVGALRGGLSKMRMSALDSAFGISRRTVERWMQWWRESFPFSAVGRDCARKLPPEDMPLASRLVSCFGAMVGPVEQASMMGFLARSG